MPVSLNAVSMKAKGMLSPSTCYQFEDPTFGTTGSSLSSITPYFIYSSRSSSLTLDEFQKLTEFQAVKTSVLIGSEISVCKASYHYVSNFVGCRASSSRQENPNKQLADRLLQQSEAVTAQSFAAITNFAGIFRLQEENRDKVSQRNHDLATPKLRNEITTESLVETRQQLRAVEEAAGAALAAAAEVARTRLFSSLPPY